LIHEAYAAQCAQAESRHETGQEPRRGRLILFALAFGTFAIGTGEFGSNGIIQLFSASLRVDVPTATWAVTAYAIGVMLGSPLITIAAARLNRRTVLLLLMAGFVLGNLLSAAALDIGMLIGARLLTGMVQGAYFGAGAVVAAYVFGPGRGGKAFAVVMSGLTIATVVGSPLATLLGQHAGWRATYLLVAGTGALALAALTAWLPRTRQLAGAPVRQELQALRRPGVWLMMAVASLGISSIFAVYTFIGPFVTTAAHRGESVVPIGLAVFGLGMAAGNALGGQLADRHSSRGLVLGYAGTLVVLVVLGLGGHRLAILFPGFFCVGALMMMAIPTIQVRLTSAAPQAPTLMGALNLAALNLANALGALGGALTLSLGFGTLSTVWAGFVLTAAGLALFLGAVVAGPVGGRFSELLSAARHDFGDFELCDD